VIVQPSAANAWAMALPTQPVPPRMKACRAMSGRTD
jgi:hypothetical protein